MAKYQTLEDMLEEEKQIKKQLNNTVETNMEHATELMRTQFHAKMKKCKSNEEKLEVCSKYLLKTAYQTVQELLFELENLRKEIKERQEGLFD